MNPRYVMDCMTKLRDTYNSTGGTVRIDSAVSFKTFEYLVKSVQDACGAEIVEDIILI